ncbi:MAG: iron ABC transporter permease [Spirochaetales bacterium]|nr:iron ABC transporter permease [Spirochaetales bacterium]
MKRLSSLKIIYLVLSFGLFAIALLSVWFGTAEISFEDVFKIIANALFRTDIFSVNHTSQIIVLQLRLPRMILALLCGASLGVSGSVLQCLFNNPMADPYVMGISSGAAFGVTLSVISGLGLPFLVQLSSFGGALLSVVLVLVLSGITGKPGQSLVILLSGIAVSLFFSALTSMFMYLNQEQAEKIMFWTFGSLSGANWTKCFQIAVFVLPVLGLLFFQWKTLNLLSQGDEAARSLGIDPPKARLFLLILTSLITSFTVSVTGIIGFVGLMVPHILRLMMGPNHKTLLPLSALGGALVLVLSDSISRVILSPSEIPVGIVTSLIGAPYLFLTIAMKQKVRIP